MTTDADTGVGRIASLNCAGEDYARLSAKRHPGESRLYARVLAEGTLAVGDPVAVVTGAPEPAR